MGTWSISPETGGVSIDSNGKATFPRNTGNVGIVYTIKYTDDNGCVGTTTYTVTAGSECQSTRCTFSTELRNRCNEGTGRNYPIIYFSRQGNDCGAGFTINWTATAGSLSTGGSFVTTSDNPYTADLTDDYYNKQVTIEWQYDDDHSISGHTVKSSNGNNYYSVMIIPPNIDANGYIRETARISISDSNNNTLWVSSSHDGQTIDSNMQFTPNISPNTGTDYKTYSFAMDLDSIIHNIDDAPDDGYFCVITGTVTQPPARDQYGCEYWIDIDSSIRNEKYTSVTGTGQNCQATKAKVRVLNIDRNTATEIQVWETEDIVPIEADYKFTMYSDPNNPTYEWGQEMLEILHLYYD